MLAHPQFRRRDGRSIRARTTVAQYTPLQVMKAYGVPTSLAGSGVTVGIVELGGAFSQADYDAFMGSLGIKSQTITVVPVNGNSPQSDPGGANVEVMLDVEIVGAVAPAAKIRLYFADNSAAGFVAAVQQACSECQVVSISWGGPETSWSATDRYQMDAVMAAAASRGVTIYVAAGDNGSNDGVRVATVDYPASSPHAIGVGGTSLLLNPDGSIASETTWNDGSRGGATGGGLSIYYTKPAYQQAANPKAMRGVPDRAALADPETGLIIRADGQVQTIGGTSAAAPFWAAVDALYREKTGGVGLPNETCYVHSEWFRDILTGNNGGENAGPGYDETTGMGSPNGPAIFSTIPVPPSPPAPLPPLPPSPSPSPVSWPCLKRLADKVFGMEPHEMVSAAKAALPVVRSWLTALEKKLSEKP